MSRRSRPERPKRLTSTELCAQLRELESRLRAFEDWRRFISDLISDPAVLDEELSARARFEVGELSVAANELLELIDRGSFPAPLARSARETRRRWAAVRWQVAQFLDFAERAYRESDLKRLAALAPELGVAFLPWASAQTRRSRGIYGTLSKRERLTASCASRRHSCPRTRPHARRRRERAGTRSSRAGPGDDGSDSDPPSGRHLARGRSARGRRLP